MTFSASRKKRLNFFIVALSILILIVVWRYFTLMVLTPTPETTVTRESYVERGPILDRNGELLAMQTDLVSVSAWTPHIDQFSDYETISARLALLLNMDGEELFNRLTGRQGYHYVKRKLPPAEAEAVRQEIEAGRLPGIKLEPEFGRTYPQKSLAAHVVGHVDLDNNGLDGLERSLNHFLAPKPGEGQEEVYGNQVILTIDINIQYIAEKIALKAYEEHNADSLLMLVMHAKTGEVLAWVSFPTFDPNRYYDYDADARRNRPALYAYEPGSVFKIFSLSTMLDAGVISPTETFFCNGSYEKEFPNGDVETINCLGYHGHVDVADIIKVSCNAGTAYASDKMESWDFFQRLSNLGFGQRTELPLAGQLAGKLKPVDQWSGRTKPTIAFGQEILTTPIQLVSAATALTNEGILLEPRLVKKILTMDGRVVEEYGRQEVGRVLEPETARTMLAAMETALEQGGTAWRTRIEGVRISAKSGTGEIFDENTGTYSEEAFLASAIAVFPSDDPELIIYTAIENPKAGEIYGGRIATPIIQETGNELITYLGIDTDLDHTLPVPEKITVTTPGTIEIGDTLPNLIGLNKKQLLPLVRRQDLKVMIVGEGWVVSQFPEPGTPLEAGMEIRLELR